MSEKFVKKWQVTGDTEGLREAIFPSDPLKPKILKAANKVDNQVRRLENAADELTQRDRTLFSKLVEAYGEHDDERAKMLANELAEVRKTQKFMVHSSIALEQVLLRLRTVSEIGDIVSTLSPAVGVLTKVKTEIGGVMPKAERELDEAGTILNDLIMEASQSTGFGLNFDVGSGEARKILEEAAAIAEQRMKEKFPPLPSGPEGAGWTINQAEER